jgi:hypothetical protein
MFPNGPVNFSDPISPGDAIHASVTYNGGGFFTLVLSDQTRGWTHTIDAGLRHPALASAEVIAEAPSDIGGVLPLADFGTAAFTDASADGAPLASFAPEPITMADGGIMRCSVGDISPSGAFTVAWRHS